VNRGHWSVSVEMAMASTTRRFLSFLHVLTRNVGARKRCGEHFVLFGPFFEENDMKKVKMFLVAALLAGVGQVANAQHGGCCGHSGHASHSGGKGQSGQDRHQMTHDQLRIAAQKICPVTGGKLGSMGDPVKAKIGEEEVFLCCQGCRNKEINEDHWATIHANIAKAQGKCPVMNKPLPKNPKGTIVEGQVVYICCPGCGEKIEADPKTYLRKVDALYTASVKPKKSSQ
jgi:hypothetical protein